MHYRPALDVDRLFGELALCFCFRGGDQAHTTLRGEVGPTPLQHDDEAILETDQSQDMD